MAFVKMDARCIFAIIIGLIYINFTSTAAIMFKVLPSSGIEHTLECPMREQRNLTKITIDEHPTMSQYDECHCILRSTYNICEATATFKNKVYEFDMYPVIYFKIEIERTTTPGRGGTITIQLYDRGTDTINLDVVIAPGGATPGGLNLVCMNGAFNGSQLRDERTVKGCTNTSDNDTTDDVTNRNSGETGPNTGETVRNKKQNENKQNGSSNNLTIIIATVAPTLLVVTFIVIITIVLIRRRKSEASGTSKSSKKKRKNSELPGVVYADINNASLAPRSPDVVAQEEAEGRSRMESSHVVLNYADIDFGQPVSQAANSQTQYTKQGAMTPYEDVEKKCTDNQDLASPYADPDLLLRSKVSVAESYSPYELDTAAPSTSPATYAQVEKKTYQNTGHRNLLNPPMTRSADIK